MVDGIMTGGGGQKSHRVDTWISRCFCYDGKPQGLIGVSQFVPPCGILAYPFPPFFFRRLIYFMVVVNSK